MLAALPPEGSPKKPDLYRFLTPLLQNEAQVRPGLESVARACEQERGCAKPGAVPYRLGYAGADAADLDRRRRFDFPAGLPRSGKSKNEPTSRTPLWGKPTGSSRRCGR